MAGRVEGMGVVVTGATKGLGRETALLLAEEGARVVGTGRDEADGRRLEADARGLPGEVAFVAGDVRREEEVAAAVAACRARFGRLDAMVANAGILGPEGPLHETTLEGWDEVNDVNLKGCFLCVKHALIAMLDQDTGGSIVTVGSILSLTADPFISAYTATKTGVLGLTRAVAVDYAARGIRANCVLPGDMETPMIQAYFAGQPDPAAARAEMEGAYPVRRLAHPREVAGAILYLVSAESRYVNGTHLLVDGALTAKTY
ncbi:MAG: SDR family oxidoreductase [Thermoleophilia bacterium]|jgi:NAD(P)-dependent dehydrogenase (short-subunit alcohol dehydrogenase family)|nr:SDR family oxidoreductase [Thermoleophilia bacterium]